MKNTKERIVDAATNLLDEAGYKAVTLRAVGHASEVSHNATYKHFESRDALLGAVAERDFVMLHNSFEEIAKSKKKPIIKLRAAIEVFVGYGRQHPQRYSLLFSDKSIAALGGSLEESAMAAFVSFAGLVKQCQSGNERLTDVDTKTLTALIYGTLHGLVDLEIGGRAKESKGLGNMEETLKLFLQLMGLDG